MMLMSIETSHDTYIFRSLLENEKMRGEELSKIFGLSKATISRRIKELNSQGFFIDVNESGYSIPTNDKIENVGIYLKRLTGKIVYNGLYFESCESSQDIAEDMAKRGAEEGNLVICGEIKNARGRLGRKWQATKGGLWFSLILRPRSLERIHLISLAMSYSVSKSIEDVLGLRAQVKWPNDVLINEKKVCGILSEAKIEQDRPIYSIVGVGLNANNVIPEELREIAVSLKEASKREVPILPVLGRLLYIFDTEYKNLMEGRVQKVLENWKSRSSTIGKRVRVIFNEEVKEGKAIDIAQDGALILLLDSGEKTRIYAGDISHLFSV
ncbi:MAG: biotin--[acetyl-CoA-carboxylase] ligase [Fervidicoccaceae archaeon]